MTVPCGFNSGIRFGVGPIGWRARDLPSNVAGDEGRSVQVSLARAKAFQRFKCTFMRPQNILTENWHFISVDSLCRIHEDSMLGAGLSPRNTSDTMLRQVQDDTNKSRT